MHRLQRGHRRGRWRNRPVSVRGVRGRHVLGSSRPRMRWLPLREVFCGTGHVVRADVHGGDVRSAQRELVLALRPRHVFDQGHRVELYAVLLRHLQRRGEGSLLYCVQRRPVQRQRRLVRGVRLRGLCCRHVLVSRVQCVLGVPHGDLLCGGRVGLHSLPRRPHLRALRVRLRRVSCGVLRPRRVVLLALSRRELLARRRHGLQHMSEWPIFRPGGIVLHVVLCVTRRAVVVSIILCGYDRHLQRHSQRVPEHPTTGLPEHV